MPRVGYKMTPEHRLKISESCKKGGVGVWMTGRRLQETTKAKLREINGGKNNPYYGKVGWSRGLKRPEHSARMRGENHPQWITDRGNLKTDRRQSYDVRYRVWMKEVKNRDNWRCALKDEHCAGRLEAHHIFRWSDNPGLRYEVSNGITLCTFHHPRKRCEEDNIAGELTKLVLNK